MSPKKVEPTGKQDFAAEFIKVLKVTWPLMLGNILEWYEFAIYDSVMPYIAPNFFHDSKIGASLGFAVTFCVRPLGGLLMGLLADRIGRKRTVMITLAGMIIATVGQGLMPSYLCCGDTAGSIGFVVFMIFRIVQGISAAGEIGAMSAYLMETAPPEMLGAIMSMVYVTNYFAFVLATLVVALLSYGGEDFMNTWGWRIPFVISIVPGAIAMLGRSSMPESEEFLHLQEELEQEHQESPPSACQSALSFIRSYFISLLILVFGMAGTQTFWFLGPFTMVSEIKAGGMNGTTADWISVFAQLVGTVGVLLTGILTDKCGVGFVAFLGAALIAVLSVPMCALAITMPTNLTVQILNIVIVCGIVYAVCGATINLWCAEMFPTRVRGLGLGIGYNLGMAVFSGFGQTMVEILTQFSSVWAAPVYMAVFGLISAIFVLLGLLANRHGLVQLTHRRHTPYFRICGKELNTQLAMKSEQKAKVPQLDQVSDEFAC